MIRINKGKKFKNWSIRNKNKRTKHKQTGTRMENRAIPFCATTFRNSRNTTKYVTLNNTTTVDCSSNNLHDNVNFHILSNQVLL